VTNDWINYGNIRVKLTEVGIALEEVVVSKHRLTGFLEIDSNNIPIYENRVRYAIPGLETSYEGGSSKPNAVNRSKFDRETLTTLLGVEKVDIDQILRNCNYSKQFIKRANDLQIMDAISECYEEYKVLNR